MGITIKASPRVVVYTTTRREEKKQDPGDLTGHLIIPFGIDQSAIIK